jgi:hypothetical protein
MQSQRAHEQRVQRTIRRSSSGSAARTPSTSLSPQTHSAERHRRTPCTHPRAPAAPSRLWASHSAPQSTVTTTAVGCCEPMCTHRDSWH